MSSIPHKLGLRERKKAQTRAAIQQQALRLFRDQGYDATTIDQIAEASNIAPATFFRYFATKEDLVLFDVLDFIMLENGEPPADLSPIGAVAWLYKTAHDKLSPEQMEQQRLRFALIGNVPALRSRLAKEVMDHTELLSQFIAKRTGQSLEGQMVKTLAGAIVGVMLMCLLDSESRDDYGTVIHRALGQLEALVPKPGM